MILSSRASACIFLCLALAFSACRQEKSDSYPAAPVILISIDTLRSDHLPAYGYTGVATPNIDRFRKDSILFTRAYSPSPMTLPSHVSMLTGKLPNEHGVRNNIGFRLDSKKNPTLPELLERKGYKSGAAVSSYVLRGETGLGPIFDWYQDAISPRPGAAFSEFQRAGSETEALARKWISSAKGQPFFFFLHLYEPHVPYDPPEPFRSRFPNPYDGEIAASDAILGDFFSFLRQEGIYDRALIIVTSDHGEGLGDHGEEQHSILLYREAIQVPLLVKLPHGDRGGETVEKPAQLTDLFNTILTATGTEPKNPAKLTLFDLEGLKEPRYIYSETLYPRIHLGWSELKSVIRDDRHYIHSQKPELYDLRTDPSERVNLIAGDRRTTAELRAFVESQPDPEIRLDTVDPEAAAKLSALGYIGAVRSRDGNASLANPVEQIHFLDDIREALNLAKAGKRKEAISALQLLLEKSPSLIEVRLQLAELLVNEGEDQEALEQYQLAMDNSVIFSPDVVRSVANLMLKVGKLDEATRYADLLRTQDPFRGEELLARIAMRRGQLAEASAHADAALSAKRLPEGLVLSAEVKQREGRMDEALKLLDEGERLATELGLHSVYRLNFVRGDLLARMDRMAEAKTAYEKEIQDFPSNLDAYGALAVVLFLEGDSAAVEKLLERMTTMNHTPRAYAMAAKTMEAFGDSKAAARWREKGRQL